jgi:urea transport system permease protein
MRIARGSLLTVLTWVVLFSLPLVLSDWNAALFAQYLTYGMFALSLALIWGGAGILSFGQAIFFGIGAYSMALVTLGKLPLLGESAWAGLRPRWVGSCSGGGRSPARISAS